MSDALVMEVIRKTVTVECAVEEAFRVFTADAISWWPVETHSIHGTVDEIVFEPRVGGAVYEARIQWRARALGDGSRVGPPHRLVLAWNILEREGDVTEVEVRFLPEGEATRVELEHRGWENVELEGPAKRGNYDTGWDAVLGEYVDRV